ncbi:MAG: DUF1667 domain-containing protein [Promethearchaeota archaeon]
MTDQNQQISIIKPDGQKEVRYDERDIICVICPNSCRLKVWRDKNDQVQVKGNQCPRGEKYGKSEYIHPVRMLITTMRIENGVLPVIPVRTTIPIPKELIFDAIKIVNQNLCRAPIKMNTVLIKNILGTGVDVISSRDMESSNIQSRVKSKYDGLSLEQTLHYSLIDEFYNSNENLSINEKLRLKEIESRILKRLESITMKSENQGDN